MVENEKKQKIIKIILFVLSLLIVFFFFYFLTLPNKEKDTIKVKERGSYRHSSGLVSHLPSLDYDNLDVELVNKEMNDDYQRIIMQKNSQFTYQFSEGKNYLSIVTMINELDSSLYPYPKFKTYVFDKKTKKRLSDEELLERFKVTKEQLEASFDKKLKDYYQKELDSFYLKEEECNYACFLKRREIKENTDEIKLYVDHDVLKFYRGFMVFSDDDSEEDFYRNETFLFDIER